MAARQAVRRQVAKRQKRAPGARQVREYGDRHEVAARLPHCCALRVDMVVRAHVVYVTREVACMAALRWQR